VGFEPHEFERTFQSPWYYWWAYWWDLVGRPGLDPGTLGLKGHRVHYSLFIRFREPHIHRVLRSVRSVRSVAIEKC
jgi:hypothetical protein